MFDESNLSLPASSITTRSDSAKSTPIDLSMLEADNSSSQIHVSRPSRSTQAIVLFGTDNPQVSVMKHAQQPRYQSEIKTNTNRDEWMAAAKCELKSRIDNGTWQLVELPKDCKAVWCKWVFCAKYALDGSVSCFKARPVSKGYKQKPGIDYQGTHSLVIHRSSLCALLSDAVKRDMIIHQMYVQTSFLNGTISKDVHVYMVYVSL